MKKKNLLSTLVYSTDPGFKIEEQGIVSTLPNGEQKLRVFLDKKNRGGKTVTLVEGFSGKTGDLETMARHLKNICGTGGSVKDQVTIIQGDNKDRIFNWLIKSGYILTRKM